MSTYNPFSFTPQQARKTLYLLLGIAAFLVFMFVAIKPFDFPRPIRQIWNLDSEFSVSTWFTTMLLFCTGVLCIFCSRRAKEILGPTTAFVLVIGIGFIFLSMDEASMLHEQAGRMLRRVPWVPRFSDNRGSWMLLYAIIGATIVFGFRKSILTMWKNHPDISKIVLTGFLVAASGAFLVEIISYLYTRTAERWIQTTQICIEEFLEMAGVSIIFYASMLFTIRIFRLDEKENDHP